MSSYSEDKIKSHTDLVLGHDNDLWNSLPMGLALTTMDGKLIDVNNAYARILGRTIEETLDLSYWDVTPKKYEEQEKEQLKLLSETGSYGPYEKEYIHKSGKYIPVRLQGVVYKREGIDYIWSSVEDISEIYEEREKFSKAFKFSPDCIIISRVSDGIIIDVNLMFEKMFQISRKNAVGRSGKELKLWVDHVDRYGISSYIEEGFIIHNEEFRAMRASGEVFSILASIDLIEINKIPCHISIIRDISGKKEMEQRVNSAEKMEAIGHLAGGIAHDFNNILTAIMGYSELSLEWADTHEQLGNNLQMIIKAAERAKSLVWQILSFSRQKPEENIPLYIGPIIKEAVNFIRATIPSTIKIRTKFGIETLPVLADSTKIHEMTLNLLTNAVYAMREKGTLEISYYEERIENVVQGRLGPLNPDFYTIIEIIDDGAGMNREVLQHLFDPFYSTKEIGKGTGMGLSVVFGILKGCRGNIEVYSNEGKGSLFRLYFPKTEEPVTDKIDTHNIYNGHNEKIFYIDDESLLCNLADHTLKSLGYNVRTFTNSREALTVFRENPHVCDLVITDQTMPEMTGLELSQELLSIRENLPIILCTGYSSKVDEEISREAGIKEFVMKPFKPQEIGEKIFHLLDRDS